MRRISAALLAFGCWWLTGARAQEAEQQRPEAGPELDFLEYLGAWAEEDDEWLAIEEWQKEIGADSGRAEESESERDDDDESE
jgi:hypothetical protein